MELKARAEPRSPRAGRGEEEEDEELRVAKRRKVLCSEFAAVTSSDEEVASGFLAGNGWHLEVGPAAGGEGSGRHSSTLCLCVSESAGRLLRGANERAAGGRRGLGGARQLVSALGRAEGRAPLVFIAENKVCLVSARPESQVRSASSHS